MKFVVLAFVLFIAFLFFKSWQGKKNSRILQSSKLKTKKIPSIKELPFYYRILDYLLMPAMWVFAKFKPPLMETHPWHMQNIHYDLIPKSIGKNMVGNDPSPYDFNSFGLFHIPIFGGWKNYTVFEAKDFDKYWRIGWKIDFYDSKKIRVCQVQRLKIYDSQVALLTGIDDSKKLIFGINDKNEPMELEIVGKGILGDGRFPRVRLF
jgi:hypothetical protein